MLYAIIIAVVLGGAAGWLLRNYYLKDNAGAITEHAQRRSRDLTDAARRRADRMFNEAKKQGETIMEELRQEFISYANERGAEFAVREGALKAREVRFQTREKRISEVEALLRTKKEELAKKEEEVEFKKLEEEELFQLVQKTVEDRAQITLEEAKKEIVSGIVEEMAHQIRRENHLALEELASQQEKKAARIIEIAIGRYSGEYFVERPNYFFDFQDEETAREVIADQGASFVFLKEQYGVELAVTEDQKRLVISGQDFIGREVARRGLAQIFEKGRFDPRQVRKAVERAAEEVRRICEKTSRETPKLIQTGPLRGKIAETIGKLRFRTSYTQNQWSHALEVGHLSGLLADELGIDGTAARRAGLLHDIGKALDHMVEGGHAVIGAALARENGEKEEVANAIGAHHGDEQSNSPLAYLVSAADSISGGRPGARHERVESYFERVAELEHIAKKQKGVSKVYALHAGREIRVFVDHLRVSDAECGAIADRIARQIEEELTYPGQIQVMVIRETVATHTAS
jgi:ribonuclease Y